ncbi:MAG: hypothetical protein KF865_10985 [Bdellovibrionaceae bacterium]|nr:hypothetical protein [Pseudobdellovibrionaceae bacterium]
MDLEKQLQDLPKPVLAALVIGVAIFVMIFVVRPPHTICDAQAENIRKNHEGILFPRKGEKKRTMPGRIQQAMESCRFGNSSGACYEYFDILRRAAVSVKSASSECTKALLKVPIEKYAKAEELVEVRDGKKTRDELSGVVYQQVTLEQVFLDGMETMARKAWGESPPEPGAQKFGWFQESELNAFCHVRDVILRAKGREGLMAEARKVYPKLPGEAPPRDPATGVGSKTFIPKRATQVYAEKLIFERSLFSAPCDFFR